MKKNHGIVQLLLIILTIILLAGVSRSSARLLNLKSSGKVAALEEGRGASFIDETTMDFSNLMGEDDKEGELCGDKDEAECMKRRITAEAHLDYIYTQKHKPKP